MAQGIDAATIRGDETAARRMTWLIIALRWRAAQDTYTDVVRKAAVAQRRRSTRTGKRLHVATIAANQRDFEYSLDRLDKHLLGLAQTPTPSYREWCRLVSE
jgi:hypothetical protein